MEIQAKVDDTCSGEVVMQILLYNQGQILVSFLKPINLGLLVIPIYFSEIIDDTQRERDRATIAHTNERP